MKPIKTFEPKYRAWFQHGGYKSFPSYEDAMNAGDEQRGVVVRVDRFQQEILWVNPHKDMD